MHIMLVYMHIELIIELIIELNKYALNFMLENEHTVGVRNKNLGDY